MTPPRAGGRGAPTGPQVRSTAGTTDEAAATVRPDLIETVPPDPEVRRTAQRVAARLLVPRPTRPQRVRRGSRELTSLPYRDGGAVELDLDRTVEHLAEHPFPEATDIVVRERSRRRRSVVLAMDLSGSMRGERVKTAAAALAAIAAELRSDDLAVVAFWSDAAVLLELGEPVRPAALLDALLSLPARGLTNVAFPLQVAARQLESVGDGERRVLLVSDCVHNAGPDPRPSAAALPRLDVLLDTTAEKDADLARDLARAGNGLLLPVASHRDVVPALARAFGS